MKLLRVPNDHCKGDSLARPFYWLSTLIGGRTICDVYKNKMEFQVDFLAHPSRLSCLTIVDLSPFQICVPIVFKERQLSRCLRVNIYNQQ